MSLGKILLTIDALGLLFGAPIADMNETHQYNPRWPPHAKYSAPLPPHRHVVLPFPDFTTVRPSLSPSCSASLLCTTPGAQRHPPTRRPPRPPLLEGNRSTLPSYSGQSTGLPGSARSCFPRPKVLIRSSEVRDSRRRGSLVASWHLVLRDGSLPEAALEAREDCTGAGIQVMYSSFSIYEVIHEMRVPPCDTQTEPQNDMLQDSNPSSNPSQRPPPPS